MKKIEELEHGYDTSFGSKSEPNSYTTVDKLNEVISAVNELQDKQLVSYGDVDVEELSKAMGGTTVLLSTPPMHTKQQRLEQLERVLILRHDVSYAKSRPEYFDFPTNKFIETEYEYELAKLKEMM